jgi:Cdc6-like AAA superfamily ATPase
MTNIPTCFFAYPSEPAQLSEIVELAIDEINKGELVKMMSWKKTKISGKFVIDELCKSIDENVFFACDITCLNPNVLFELGYAIAKNKRIWVTRDKSYDATKTSYTKLEILTTLGHASYTNSISLVEAFYHDRPHEDLQSTVYKMAIEMINKEPEQHTLLYLKSFIDTESSRKATLELENKKLPIITDDPNEVKTNTFQWYIKNIFFSCGVLAHMVSPTRDGWELHNAKYALFSGLAYGFGKPLLMLAGESYRTPIDYRDLLKIYNTANQCVNYIKNWLPAIINSYTSKVQEYEAYQEKRKGSFELQNISIGNYMAENESENLLNYFVTTAAYTEALRSQESIFIGRKGTGKTANLYKLVDELGSDARNYICVIKPAGYELEGLIRMLKEVLPKVEKGFLIESFWKFLLYTELAKSVFESLSEKPVYYERDKEEDRLYIFVNTHSYLINNEFSIRLENAVTSLCGINFGRNSADQRIKISEILHGSIIVQLQNLLTRYFERNKKVVLLIDNLDKAWKVREDLLDLSNIILGLLSVARDIRDTCRKSFFSSKGFDFSMILFLRSDIFYFIVGQARERDKIPYSLLRWDNPDFLLRVIEERFSFLHDSLVTPDEIWSKYFCSTVNGKPVKNYIVEHIIPRPRDIIYICKAAIDEAINAGHGVVEEADLLLGEKKYSHYIFDSLLVENGIRVQKLESILYEFTGANSVLLYSELVDILNKANIESKDIDYVIDILVGLSFLGLEIKDDEFAFLYYEVDKNKYDVLANKLIESRSACKEKRYAINKPFHAYLEINNAIY